MASGPIISWQIDGKTVETVIDFIFGGSKITAGGGYSREIKRRLLLGRKVMTNLDRLLNARDITLPTKFCLVKAMVFPVVMYGCESWTVKKAEHFFHDPADVGNLISGSSAFSKSSLNIWKFTVHISLQPGLENFEHHFTSV